MRWRTFKLTGLAEKPDADAEVRMRAFDQLAPALKQLLVNSPLNFDPVEIRDHWLERGEQDCLDWVRDAEAMTLRSRTRSLGREIAHVWKSFYTPEQLVAMRRRRRQAALDLKSRQELIAPPRGSGLDLEPTAEIGTPPPLRRVLDI